MSYFKDTEEENTLTLFQRAKEMEVWGLAQPFRNAHTEFISTCGCSRYKKHFSGVTDSRDVKRAPGFVQADPM